MSYVLYQMASLPTTLLDGGYKYTPSSTDSSGLADRYKRSNATVMSSAGSEVEWLGEWTNRPKTRGK